MPEILLRQLRSAYSACGPFTKNKERLQKHKTGDSQYIYQNELGKACFQHDMAHGDLKDLTRRTATDKILGDNYLILLKIQDIMDINIDINLLQLFLNFLIKRLQVGQLKMKTFLIQNYQKYNTYQLLEEKKSTLDFYRQCLGCRFTRYAIDKQI